MRFKGLAVQQPCHPRFRPAGAWAYILGIFPGMAPIASGPLRFGL